MTIKLNEEKIIELYTQENKSIEKIAKLFNCGDKSIQGILKQNGIRIKNRNEYPTWNQDKKLIFSEEHKRNISLSKKGKTWEQIYGIEKAKKMKEDLIKRIIGSKHTEKTKRKIGLSQKGRKVSEETRKKMSLIFKGRPNPKQSKTRKKLFREGKLSHKGKNHPLYGKHLSKEHKQKLSKSFSDKNNPFYGKKHPEKVLNILSEKGKKRWKINREKYLKSLFNKRCPNKSEIFLDKLLQQNFPNNWKFVGNGYTFIGGRCPDFLNINGTRQVIELFGKYWHSPLLNPNVKWNKTYNETIKHYKKYGFDCLILWDYELQNPNKVLEKIKQFES